MLLQFGVIIPVQRCARHAHAIVLTIEQANRSVSLLGFDNQASSATCQLSSLATEHTASRVYNTSRMNSIHLGHSGVMVLN